MTWHECWGPDYWRTYLGPPGRIGWLLESLAMRLPDAIIAASPQTAERLRQFTKDRVPVVVAPNGIDLAAIGAVGAATDPADVVVVGRLLPHKRIDLLLEALTILKQEGRPVTARVVGTGPQLEALVRQAHSLGLADFVDFRQDIESQDLLYAVLKAARVAVFPSEREGFGIAVLEALACGVPVITTSAPDNLAQHLVTRSAGGGVVCEPTARALAEAIAQTLAATDSGGLADDRWLGGIRLERDHRQRRGGAVVSTLPATAGGLMTTAVLERQEPQVTRVRAARRRRPDVGGLIGVGVIAALYPARQYWVADVAALLLFLTVPGVLALRAIRVPARRSARVPDLHSCGFAVHRHRRGAACRPGRPEGRHPQAAARIRDRCGDARAVCSALGDRQAFRETAARFPWRAVIPADRCFYRSHCRRLRPPARCSSPTDKGRSWPASRPCLMVATLLVCLLSANRLSRGTCRR